LVAPDRLRFDFNHPEAMTGAQLRRVEKIVNDAVAADMEVMPKLKSREDAIAEGAMALFGEKYGETVRTISILPRAFTEAVRGPRGRWGRVHHCAQRRQNKYSNYAGHSLGGRRCRRSHRQRRLGCGGCGRSRP
jgi:hypothetical protein